MARLRDNRFLAKRSTRAWGLRVGLALAIAVALATVPYAIADRGSAARAAALVRELSETRAEIARLERENAALIRDITALKRNPGKIADLARSKLQMTRPDELVIAIIGDAE